MFLANASYKDPSESVFDPNANGYVLDHTCSTPSTQPNRYMMDTRRIHLVVRIYLDSHLSCGYYGICTIR